VCLFGHHAKASQIGDAERRRNGNVGGISSAGPTLGRLLNTATNARVASSALAVDNTPGLYANPLSRYTAGY